MNLPTNFDCPEAKEQYLQGLTTERCRASNQPFAVVLVKLAAIALIAGSGLYLTTVAGWHHVQPMLEDNANNQANQ